MDTVGVESPEKPLQSGDMPTATVLTVSDSCSKGAREDLSGPAVATLLRSHGFAVDGCGVLPDEQAPIEEWLKSACGKAALVVTTGGTGLAPRDVTPEATRNVCDRLVDGISERMRSEGLRQTPFAPLSRALCGTRGTSLILNLPGSPRGAVQSLEVVLPILSHALALLSGAYGQHSEGETGSTLKNKELERP